jgi:hypothetical protein
VTHNINVIPFHGLWHFHSNVCRFCGGEGEGSKFLPLYFNTPFRSWFTNGNKRSYTCIFALNLSIRVVATYLGELLMISSKIFEIGAISVSFKIKYLKKNAHTFTWKRLFLMKTDISEQSLSEIRSKTI